MSAEIRQMMKSTTTDAFWQMLRASEPQAPDDYRLLWFGGTNVALATELADLVVDGPKRATTTLLRDFETGAQPVFPKPGDFWVLVDCWGHPLCVVQTTQVQLTAFADVDEAFAWDEGEGDRSLAWWREAHFDYFSRQAAIEGFVFDERSMVVLERFTVIWPTSETKE
jgi:uncharacterized protein YhfF